MIDIDELCIELNNLLPSNGWSLRYPLTPFKARDPLGRYAAAVWGNGHNGDRTDDGPEIGLQVYERDKRPVIIVLETRCGSGQIEPDTLSAMGIISALNEFRWVIAT